MDADHHMMRHMRDKEDRDVHLQHMKERRMSQHQEDIVARNGSFVQLSVLTLCFLFVKFDFISFIWLSESNSLRIPMY